MDRKTILGEIKKLMTFGTEEEVKVEAFVDAKLNDGLTIVRVDGEDFAEGLVLYVVTEEGLIAAEPGVHTLEDGRAITVDELGVIQNITEAEEAVEAMAETKEEEEMEEEKKEEEMEEEKEEEMGEHEDEEKEEMAYKIKKMEERIEEMENIVKEMIKASSDVKEFSKQVVDKLDTFVKETPAELHFQSIKSEYKSLVNKNKNEKFDKLEQFAKFRKK